eukprot:TRINITY_DN541_c0_g1_i15.p1 TRINITY_DN541_c0_g1~~TRINITY_DN541_c0_g1_i15.p1  ORF type:complete len:189 (-),score=61.61 TRINITY_DN541_c0_g1_i15:3-569(-)
MKISLACLLLGLAFTSAAPDARFSCSECVDEMHKLGGMVKYGAKDIMDYLTANYCPTLPEDSHACEHDLSRHYIGMLYTIVNHFFVDGAVHICQTMGVCDARRYTCEECVEGLEWVEGYLEDPIMVAEYVVYLQQNFCTSDMHHCHDTVAAHFPAMHDMAMEKFFIPTEICNQEPVCTGEDPPTKPPQ